MAGAEPESLRAALETLELLGEQRPNVKSFDPKKVTALSGGKKGQPAPLVLGQLPLLPLLPSCSPGAGQAQMGSRQGLSHMCSLPSPVKFSPPWKQNPELERGMAS